MIEPTGTTKERPDVYIGLVCAAGTDLTDLKSQIEAQLVVVGYKYVEIKVSSLIRELLDIPVDTDEFERIMALMEGGDAIRKHSKNGDGVASVIIAEIRRLRGGKEAPSSTAYVIDSLKNPAELGLLDQVYGRNYYTISVFRPKENRVENLKNKIAHERHVPPTDEHEKLANRLINIDEKGLGKRCQNVQETFPKADFFVDGTNEILDQIRRFIQLIFREPFITPTADEFNMFVAKAAALRSCDLSRLVGAAIVDERFGIVATGTNEVPYPGGGFFVEGLDEGIGDNRDKEGGHDPNYVEIHRTLIEFIEILKQTNHVETSRQANEIAEELLNGDYKEALKNARIRNLIEFGRVVHAEMHAISQAAAAGRPVKGCTLFCTTFPCHGCARHIISSGIAEVVFIEPYPKSLTERLYGKEIEMANKPLSADERNAAKRVRFRPFHGVAPTLYQRVFAMRDRKDDHGVIAKWLPKKSIPIGAVFGVERPKVETTASNSVADILGRIKVEETRIKQEIRDDEADTA